MTGDQTLWGEIEPYGAGPEVPEVGANELREYGRTSLLAARGRIRRKVWVLAGTGLDPYGGSHVRSLDASSPLRRIRQLISLINTPARTNDLPTGSMHPGGILSRVTASHTESSDLTSRQRG